MNKIIILLEKIQKQSIMEDKEPICESCGV